MDLWALVLWLDDKRLHRCTPAERAALTAAAPRDWPVLNAVRAYFEATWPLAPHTHTLTNGPLQYAVAVGCPHRVPEDRVAWADWLLGYVLAADATPPAAPAALSPAGTVEVALRVPVCQADATVCPARAVSAVATLERLCSVLDISLADGLEAAVQVACRAAHPTPAAVCLA
jgi:hypothetical protein